MFETDPGDEGGAKGEVEESFVGDGQDDEDGGEGEEDDDEAVEIVVVWLEAVEEGYGERCNCTVVSLFQPVNSTALTYLKLTTQPLGYPMAGPF